MLGVIVPARNEEKNILEVLNNLIKCGVSLGDIFVIDNRSCDNTSNIAKSIGVKVILCDEIGYQAALKKGFNELKKRNYKKFLIIDGDNEIGINSIKRCLVEQRTYKIVIGYRVKIKRIAEKIVNSYFDHKYGIRDLMCGVKCGNIDLYNSKNALEYGIDFFKFDKISNSEICNFKIDLNERSDTRLGSPLKVNIDLMINLIKFLIQRK